MVLDKLQPNSIEQYRKEVRSVIVRRVMSHKERFDDLIKKKKKDNIAPQHHIEDLRKALQELTHEKQFKYCINMGEILETAINFVVKNYYRTL